MNLEDLKTNYYLFDPNKFGRIYAFIDFGNVRPWAKELWPIENKFRFSVEVDIAKLADVCNWVKPEKKLFYYGYYPERIDLPKDHELNKKHRKSIFRISKARKSRFEVNPKEIKLVPHYDDNGKFIGKFPKCNFDVEMTMSMLTKIEKYDTVLLFSGDSDFGGLLRYLKDKGKKIVVVCTRNRLSSELQGVADVVVPAETLANFLRYENTPPIKAGE
jgi:uncharacterized LabA/DUF88 family protein